MAFENQTADTIHERMLLETPTDIDARQGSVTYDLTRPAAIEAENVWIALAQVLTFGFAGPEMPAQYLDLRCAEYGLTRKPASKATGSVTFTGTNGTVIPAGTEVITADEIPIAFVTTAAATITSGTAAVASEAKLGGVSGNVAPGKITLTTGNITGIASVTNSASFAGGADIESDDSLLQRYYDRVRTPASSGNSADYRQWAKSISGINDAKVYPVWNGNGSVKVVLLDGEKTAPTQVKVTEVATYIESMRPIGATVTVVGATEVPINVSATLTLASGGVLSNAITEITNALKLYLAGLAFTDSVVRYSKIANIIGDASNVLDYTGLTVNGGTTNVSIADGSVAVVGTVALT